MPLGRILDSHLDPSIGTPETTVEVETVSPDTPLTPLLLQAYAAWSAVAAGPRPPRWQTRHFLAFPSALIPSAVLAEVDAEADDYRIRYWGSARADAHKCNLTNSYVSQMRPAALARKYIQEHRTAAAAAAPLKFSTECRLPPYAAAVFCELRLPFCNDGAKVTHVLSLEEPTPISARMFFGETLGAGPSANSPCASTRPPAAAPTCDRHGDGT